jgi:hypothetical protein
MAHLRTRSRGGQVFGAAVSARRSARRLGPAGRVAGQDREAARGQRTQGALVELARSDPRDLGGRVALGDVGQARDQEGLAEPLAAMFGPGPGRAEPAQATVVAVVGGEGGQPRGRD